MNENIGENLEELEEQIGENEGAESGEETGEAVGEIPEDTDVSDEAGTESDSEGLQPEETLERNQEATTLPAEELEFLTEKVEEMHTYLAERDMSIFEKPLSKWTTTEGLLLLVVLILTAELIFKKIGGILRCEKE